LLAIFAVFLLLSACAYAKRTLTGRANGLNTYATLTTNHLLWKGDSWLPMILAVGNGQAFTGCSPFLTVLTGQLLPSWSSYPQAKFSVRNIWRNSKSDQMKLRKNSSPSSISEPHTQLKPDRPAEMRVLSSAGLSITISEISSVNQKIMAGKLRSLPFGYSGTKTISRNPFTEIVSLSPESIDVSRASPHIQFHLTARSQIGIKSRLQQLFLGKGIYALLELRVVTFFWFVRIHDSVWNIVKRGNGSSEVECCSQYDVGSVDQSFISGGADNSLGSRAFASLAAETKKLKRERRERGLKVIDPTVKIQWGSAKRSLSNQSVQLIHFPLDRSLLFYFSKCLIHGYELPASDDGIYSGGYERSTSHDKSQPIKNYLPPWSLMVAALTGIIFGYIGYSRLVDGRQDICSIVLLLGGICLWFCSVYWFMQWKFGF
jgi:hypothetical protein